MGRSAGKLITVQKNMNLVNFALEEKLWRFLYMGGETLIMHTSIYISASLIVDKII